MDIMGRLADAGLDFRLPAAELGWHCPFHPPVFAGLAGFLLRGVSAAGALGF